MEGTQSRRLGGSGTAIGLVCVMIQAIEPNWFGNNAWILPLALIWIAISVLLWFIQYPWMQKALGIYHSTSPEPTKDTNSGVQVGGDISGRFLHAKSIGSYYEAPSVTAPSIPEPPSPTIMVTNDVVMSLVQENGVIWRHQHDGHPMMVASVLNRNETETTKAFPAEGIVVSLQFDNYEGPVRYISRAYWVDHSENVVDIKIGTFKHFLLGCAVDSHWTTFENQRDAPVDPEEMETVIGRIAGLPGDVAAPHRVTHRIVSKRIPITEGLRVTATVFSEKTGQNFAKRTFYL
jgi:hypothetical protein